MLKTVRGIHRHTMGAKDGSESCGRCSFSAVVDAVGDTDADDPADDPFAGDAIELTERELLLASAPAVVAGRIKRRLNEAARRLIYQ